MQTDTSNDIKHEVPHEFIEDAKFLKAPIIYDIGSRDAIEGIYLAKALSASETHIFEPNPSAANLCRSNIEKSTAEKIVFNEIALSDSEGEVAFYPIDPEKSERGDIGLSSMMKVNPRYTKNRGSVVQEKIYVKTTTLDSYVEGKNKPDILWIDVEGAELLVLKGAANTLNEVKLIHIEVSFRPMHVGKPLFWEIDDFLVQHGFRLSYFVGIPKWKKWLACHRLLPNPPWRWNAVYAFK